MTARKTAKPASSPRRPADGPGLADWLLKHALWIILVPFTLVLLVNLEVAQRVGVPAPRVALPALFDPIYQTFILSMTISAIQMRAFPHQARHAFRRLQGQGVITGKTKGSLAEFRGEFVRWPRHPGRIWLALALVAVSIIFNYYVTFGGDLARMLPGSQPADVSSFAIEFWLTNLLVGAGIVLNVTLVGLWIFELVATAALIHRAPKFFELHIQPMHPDGCAGFKAVGDLCLKMVYVVLVPTLFIGLWLLLGKHVSLSPEVQELIPGYVLNFAFRTPAKLVLGVLVASGIAVFFWPMVTVHRRMFDERLELQNDLDRIAGRIQELNNSLLADPARIPAEKRRGTLDEIDSLKEQYDRLDRVPTWPFNRSVLLKFISTQTIPIISLVGLGGGPLNSLLEIVLGVFE